MKPLRATFHAAGEGGAIGVEQRLRELAVAISAALDAVVANAAAARERVDNISDAARAALKGDGSSDDVEALTASAALDRAATELREAILAAENRKTAALEAEAVRVDEALVLIADVSERRGGHAALDDCLLKLPTSPVEHPGIDVINDPSPCTSALLPFRVRALPSPEASEITLRPVARSVRASPRTVLCHLSLSTTTTAGMLHSADVDALLTSLRPRISATAALVVAQVAADAVTGLRVGASDGLQPTASHLVVSLKAQLPGTLAVSVDLPSDLPGGSWVVLSQMALGDQPLAFVGFDGLSLPAGPSSLAFLVSRGLAAPCVFDAPSGQVYKTPAVSDSGVLYMPDGGHVVKVFETETSCGAARSFELPADLRVFGAAFDARTRLLLLGCSDGRIVALDTATGLVCWVSVSRDVLSSACGIAVMPDEGIGIIAAGNHLVAFHISDGSLAADVACSGGEC